MESYNLYLYHERTARGLKMRAFAEKLKTDYEPYTLNEYSYPGEKPEKKSRFAKLYDFIGTEGFRIATAPRAT